MDEEEVGVFQLVGAEGVAPVVGVDNKQHLEDMVPATLRTKTFTTDVVALSVVAQVEAGILIQIPPSVAVIKATLVLDGETEMKETPLDRGTELCPRTLGAREMKIGARLRISRSLDWKSPNWDGLGEQFRHQGRSTKNNPVVIWA